MIPTTFYRINRIGLSVLVILLSSCTYLSQNGVSIYRDVVVLPDATTDTVYYADYKSRNLFKILCGGNLDIVNSIEATFNDKEYLLFTISDISQEFMLYFIIYDIENDKLYQTDKIYLPYLGIDYYGDLSCTGLEIHHNKICFQLQNHCIELDLKDIIMGKLNIINFNEAGYTGSNQMMQLI